MANYTWSHSIDNLSSTFSDGYSSFYGLGYLDAYNPGLDKGNADYNTTNRLVVSGVWDLPWMKNSSNAFARQALGGWGISPVILIHSGYPFSIYDCSNLGLGYTCPRWIPGGQVTKGGNAGYAPQGANLFTYMNLPMASDGTVAGAGDVLAVPNCTGLYGVGCSWSNSGLLPPPRNGFNSPGFWNIDFVTTKNFKLTEKFNLQFRGEFYNLFNHHNNYVLGSNLDIEPGTSQQIQAERGTPSAGCVYCAFPTSGATSSLL